MDLPETQMRNFFASEAFDEFAAVPQSHIDGDIGQCTDRVLGASVLQDPLDAARHRLIRATIADKYICAATLEAHCVLQFRLATVG
jgi:hypothetical protein